MRVTLLAYTKLSGAGVLRMRALGFPVDGSGADTLSEFAGRLCYRSFRRPNPATATNEAYLAHIIEEQHFSVLEHGMATLLFEGVSRAFTHELVRHRHLSFSQESQRFVNSGNAEHVVPPALEGLDEAELLDDFMTTVRQRYAVLADLLQALPRKQQREAARAVLPNMTATSIVVTGNLRAWREVLAKRLSPAADAEMQRVMQAVLVELKALAPGIFQDFALGEVEG